ncbi:glycosyltransferase [Algoriphagus namhaensis]
MIFLLLLIGYVILQFLVLIWMVKFRWKAFSPQSASPPSVSILISCRNEEKLLPQLLRSLDGLHYSGEWDIWIADDQSSDDTGQIIQSWCARSAHRNFVSISTEEAGSYHTNGKANALAILCKQAKGDLLFFTDADCEVPHTWIESAGRSFPKDLGMMIGITRVKADSVFGRFQEVDWWHTLGIVKVLNDLGLGLTGLGNNMVVSRHALEKSGGFENLPDSLTEDLALCRSLLDHGFAVGQQVDSSVLVTTKAEERLSSFLAQRKRWLSGVVTLPFSYQFLLALELLFYPAVLCLIWIAPGWGMLLWAVKVAVQSFFLAFFARKTAQKLDWPYVLGFDFYQIFTASLTILYYFWPGKIEWKGRKYP